MEYIFGNVQVNGVDAVNLRTKGPEHSNLTGAVELSTEYDDAVITDRCVILRKYKSTEDVEGNCYDWYTVKDHVKTVDKEKVYRETVDAYEEALTTLGVLPLEEDDNEAETES